MQSKYIKVKINAVFFYTNFYTNCYNVYFDYSPPKFWLSIADIFLREKSASEPLDRVQVALSNRLVDLLVTILKNFVLRPYFFEKKKKNK